MSLLNPVTGKPFGSDEMVMQDGETARSLPPSEFDFDSAFPPPEEPGWFQPGSKSEAAVRGFSQAATLGFGDEIQAGVRKLLGSGDYSELRDQERAANRAASEANPGSYLAGQAAALAPTLAAGGAASGWAGAQRSMAAKGVKATTASNVGRVLGSTGKGAAVGGAYGGLAGFGNAEGTAGEQLEQTAFGAGTGAAFGGLLGFLSGGAKEAGRISTAKVAKEGMKSGDKPIQEVLGAATVKDAVKQGGKELAEEAKKFKETAGLAAVIEPVTTATVAATRAAQKIGQKVAGPVFRAYNAKGVMPAAARGMVERGAPFAAINAVLQEQDPVTTSTVAATRAPQKIGQKVAGPVFRAYNAKGALPEAARGMVERGAPFAAINAVLQEQDPVYRQAIMESEEDESKN